MKSPRCFFCHFFYFLFSCLLLFVQVREKLTQDAKERRQDGEEASRNILESEKLKTKEAAIRDAEQSTKAHREFEFQRRVREVCNLPRRAYIQLTAFFLTQERYNKQIVRGKAWKGKFSTPKIIRHVFRNN